MVSVARVAMGNGCWLQNNKAMVSQSNRSAKLSTLLSKKAGENIRTFIFTSRQIFFKAFCNPATGSFAWMGADEAEIIFLNDFRWSANVIAWANLLHVLEGDVVHLLAPKNLYRTDFELSADMPFFAISDAPLVLITGGYIDRANTDECLPEVLSFCQADSPGLSS